MKPLYPWPSVFPDYQTAKKYADAEMAKSQKILQSKIEPYEDYGEGWLVTFVERNPKMESTNLAELLMKESGDNKSNTSPVERLLTNHKEIKNKERLEYFNKIIDSAFRNMPPEDKIWFVNHCKVNEDYTLTLTINGYHPIFIGWQYFYSTKSSSVVFNTETKRLFRKPIKSENCYSLVDVLLHAKCRPQSIGPM